MKKDRSSGYRNVDYSVIKRYDVIIDDVPCTVVNVHLRCNIRDTPWCLTQEQLTDTMQSLKDSLPSSKFLEIDKDVQSRMFY